MIEAWIDGVSFSSLGIGIIRRDIPVLPDTRDYNVVIAGKDGEVDFGSEYGPRIISHECVLMANDPTTDYHAKVAQLAHVFNAKKGDVIVTYIDLPDRRYRMRYAGTMSIEKIIFDGRVTIPMKMHDPYPEALRDTSVFEYGQGLEYGQGYEYSAYTLQIGSPSETFTIENIGTADAPPLIRITGALTDLSLSDGDQTLTFSGAMLAADVLEIHCEKYTVKLNAVNAYSRSNGVFFILKPGVTTFTVNSTSPNFKIEFIFRHKYLY